MGAPSRSPRGALRCLSSLPRHVAGPEPMTWWTRTFHGPRAVPMAGVRPPFTLDQVVGITLARVRWIEGAAHGAA